MEEDNKLTRIQQIYERKPTLVEHIYEGKTVISVRELIKRIKKAGYVKIKGTGGHRKFKHAEYGKKVGVLTVSGRERDDAKDYQINQFELQLDRIKELDKKEGVTRKYESKRRSDYMINEKYNPDYYMKDLKQIETYKGKYRIYSFSDSNRNGEFCVLCPDMGEIVGQNDIDVYKNNKDLMIDDLKDNIDFKINYIKKEMGGEWYNGELKKTIRV